MFSYHYTLLHDKGISAPQGGGGGGSSLGIKHALVCASKSKGYGSLFGFK